MDRERRALRADEDVAVGEIALGGVGERAGPAAEVGVASTLPFEYLSRADALADTEPSMRFALVVDNDDLVPPDHLCGRSSCVHFGARAMREQGQRFDAALRRILAR